jgi:hypothetical protein
MEQTTNDDLNDHAVERAQRSDAERISEECDALKAMLLEKNRAYGSSALSPVRIFAKSDTVEQIRVRIDDKLSRLMRGSAAGEDVVKDLLGYLILLRIATRKQASDIPEAFLKASREAPSIVDVLSDPNGPASKPLFPPGVGSYAALRDVLDREPLREDVGFALTDAEAAEAERAVDAEEWGGEVRRKLGIARGHLDGLAQDLEETGGWEETVKEIRQTLRETADPNPSERHGWEFLAVENQRLQEEVEGLERDSDTLQAAYDAAGISGLQNLAKRITEMREESERLRETLRAFDLERELRARAEQSYAAMREEIVRLRRERDDGHVKTEQLVSCVAERDALREKLALRVHEPGTFAALQAEVEAFRRAKESGT